MSPSAVLATGLLITVGVLLMTTPVAPGKPAEAKGIVEQLPLAQLLAWLVEEKLNDILVLVREPA